MLLRIVGVSAVFLLLVTAGQSKAQQCEAQLDALLHGIENGEAWALLMRDAWGLQPSGLHSGNRVDYGNFNQCFYFRHNHPTLGHIQGQNCMLKVRKPVNPFEIPAFRVAVCVPAACSANQLAPLLDTYFNGTLGMSIDAPAIDTDCEKQTTVTTRGWLYWCAVAFFTASIALVLMATLYERCCQNVFKKLPNFQTIFTFSLYTNCVQTLAVGGGGGTTRSPANTRGTTLECLDGLRALSVFWIIYQHTYFIQMSFPLINDDYKYQWAKTPFAMTFLSASVAVDNFLVMSGLLVTWNFFHDREKRKSLNGLSLMKMYLNRYIRLTSAIAPMILFTAAFYGEIGSGPEHASRTEWLITPCHKNWWSALLHIQNIVNPSKPCIPHAWYMSVDMQLFLLTPILLIPLWRWGKKLLWAVYFLIFLSSAYIFTVSMVYTDVFISYFLRETWHRNVLIYMATPAKAGPWLVGILLGYYLFSTRNEKFHYSKKMTTVIWCLVIAVMLAVVFGQIGDHTRENTNTRWEIALFQSLHRIAWSLCIAWIIISCFKRRGPINAFLSHPLWKPVARISYSTYLVHLMLQFLMLASRKTNQYFNDIDVLFAFCGDVGFALIVSLVWYLLYEIPFQKLAKLYLTDKRKMPSPPNPNATMANISSTVPEPRHHPV